MRAIVGYEADEIVPGQILMAGSMKWKEDTRVSVVIGPSVSPKDVVGYAENFARVDNHIEADLEFNVDNALSYLERSMGPTIYANNITGHIFRNIRFINSGVIRQIYFSPYVPWAGKWRI